jgi:hypothetical protein
MGDAPKHSPGPWRAVQGLEGNEIYANDSMLVAELNDLDPTDRGKAEVDAAIIASAPTLAAQLAEAVGLLRGLARQMTMATDFVTAGRVRAFLARVDGDGKAGG